MNIDQAREIVIATIECETPGQRMVFASRTEDCDRPIVLRHESFSPDVGWFTQSSLEMSRREMVLLRAAMGGQQPVACARTSQKIQQASPMEDLQPAILQMGKMPAAS